MITQIGLCSGYEVGEIISYSPLVIAGKVQLNGWQPKFEATNLSIKAAVRAVKNR